MTHWFNDSIAGNVLTDSIAGLLPRNSPWFGFPPFEDLFADFLRGGLDVLHFLAHAGSGRFIAPGRLGYVFFNFLKESFECLEFLHGSSLWLKEKCYRGGCGVSIR